MATNINLLRRAETPFIRKARLKRTLNIITILSVLIFIIVFLLVFLANLVFSFQARNLNKQISSSQVKINNMADIEVASRAIVDKLVVLEKIMEEEQPYNKAIERVLKILPPEVSIDQLLLDEKNFSVSLTSIRVSPFNNFIEGLISPTIGGEFFQKITLKSLIIDTNGLYRLDIGAEVK